jgi:hypothetical protein
MYLLSSIVRMELAQDHVAQRQTERAASAKGGSSVVVWLCHRFFITVS